MTFGERIRQLRLQKGYSQENMADELGISTTAYGDIERNKTDITMSRLHRLADIFNMSTTELIVDNQTNNIPHELEKLRLENEKLRIEVEKYQLEAAYWRERHDKPKEAVVVILQPQQERQKIGFALP